MTESALILACLKEERGAQKQLYDRFAPMLYSVARRYMGNREDAEDVLLAAFYKIFAYLDTYQSNGSFEGWMKRIVANEALMTLRKRKLLIFGDEKLIQEASDHFDIHAEMGASEILGLIDRLPTGYKTVFNLYVLEGMTHQEIADLLGISINTSKSQLIAARQRLQLWITNRDKP